MFVMALSAYGQHLENGATGTVRNSGTIRFRSDTGRFANEAPYTNISNAVIEFTGTDNHFTDGSKQGNGATALGHAPAWRVPGLVRYTRPNGTQLIDPRYYTDLSVEDDAEKRVPDAVYIGGSYTIVASGPRQYSGTLTYDGTALQTITEERGLSGTTNRYANLRLQNGPKRVAAGTDIRMDGSFGSDVASTLDMAGTMVWGTTADVRGAVTVATDGYLQTGTGTSDLYANVDVQRGSFVIADLSDVTTVHDAATVQVGSRADALFVMGVRTRFDVLGNFVNTFPAYTNTTFDPTSLVNYAGTTPQSVQPTAPTNPYGSLRTAVSPKTTRGNVYMVSDLSVNDADLVMVPHQLHLRTGTATYSGNNEVVGAMIRDLATATVAETYTYNNVETRVGFSVLPASFGLDVRPQTVPNAYDPMTDVQRKITVLAEGSWQGVIRVGYKQTDIPATWAATTSEKLLKMYNAYGAPTPRAVKLNPTVPPTYDRRILANSNGMAFLELSGVASSGADNLRLDNGNDILLRGSRDILRAIASGRWSNPNTWDEGREPEPEDNVVIDGFTVHAGYVRLNDNYATAERWPDSMASSVRIGATPNSSLLVGSTASFNNFSLVPDEFTAFSVQRQASTLVSLAAQDTSARDIDGGLVVYPGATFTVPNLSIDPTATVFNAGTLIVGANR